MYLKHIMSVNCELLLFIFSVDPCSSNSCHNGGTCVTRPHGTYSCQCAEGFQGNDCNTGEVIHFFFRFLLKSFPLVDNFLNSHHLSS